LKQAGFTIDGAIAQRLESHYLKSSGTENIGGYGKDMRIFYGTTPESCISSSAAAEHIFSKMLLASPLWFATGIILPLWRSLPSSFSQTSSNCRSFR
jgi:hypothetical protein